MTDDQRRSSTLRMLAVAAVAAAVGFGAAHFLPMGGHGDASDGAHSEQGSHGEGEELWTCGMHPHVLASEPGQCPICQMDLVPVRADDAGPSEAAGGGGRGREVLFYRNPMDPSVTSPVPAKDSMGMDYVPVYADEGVAAGATVRIDPAVVQNMNVRMEPVERRNLTRPVRTVGYLEYDQQRMVTVTTKIAGWVEKVYVNYLGETVRRGQPLFDVYSPELVQTEQELLSALEFARELEGAPEDARRRAQSLVESARTRLEYWDVSAEQIARLENTGEIFRTFEVVAPASGLVMKRMPGLEGMAVQPGMEIFHLANLSSLWVSVELFEEQMPWVREGTPAERISVSSLPGQKLRGTVRFFEPEVSEETRTIRAKIELPNPDGRLRKGMYATVEFEPLLVEDALVVPTQAVLQTGQRSVVLVALGEGRFEPREVALGHEAAGLTEVRSGLEEGMQVVTSAQFLLDSESRLNEAIQKMVSAHRAPESPSPSSPDAPGEPTSTEAMEEMSPAVDHSDHSMHHGPGGGA